MPHDLHRYAAVLEWHGNHGDGTSRYGDYGREYAALVEGKPTLRGSADPGFLGDPDLHNPEDLLLIALSSCHMLTYLALCARQRLRVVSYLDRAEGVMQTRADGGGQFSSVLLHPNVMVDDDAVVDRAMALHEQAHRLCFIANSCNFPVAHRPVVCAADVEVVAVQRPVAKEFLP